MIIPFLIIFNVYEYHRIEKQEIFYMLLMLLPCQFFAAFSKVCSLSI